MTELEERAGWRMHTDFADDADARASSAAAFGNAGAEVGTETGVSVKSEGPWLTAALFLMGALATNPADVG